MANTVKLKRSAVAGDAPSASDLEIGEVAINTADGLLYTKHTDGTINKITIADDELSALLSGYTTATDATSSDLIVFYDVTAGVWERSTIANAALQGEKGQKGQAGADGDKGQKGEVGSKGQKGEVGATGNDGSNGSDGDKGQKGQAGNDGSAGSNGAKGQKGEVGVQGNDGSNGDKGQKGQKGEVGANGSNGSDGANGQKGEKGQKGQDGTAGGDGSDGDKGQKGEVGAKGQKGQEGSFGGATFDYTFSTNTADSDPTSGKLKFNNANLSSASKMYIDNQDGSATSIVTFLRTIDDSTSTIKGHFRVSNRLNADDFALFTIGGSITEATGYVKVNCSYVSGSATSFSNSEDIIITFARTGDAGDTGAAGAAGSDGNDGAKGQKGQKGQTGAAGSNGSNGSKGQKGEVGAAGSNGSNGSDGAAGQKGQKGEVGANGSNGSNGSKGQKGQKGEVGANGSNGSNGSKGQKGQKGEVGAGGSDGSNGSKGEKGQKGQTGGSGSDGSDGTKGEKGQKGQTGGSGSDGSDGTKGQKGQTGAGGGTGSKGQKGEGGLTTTDADTVDGKHLSQIVPYHSTSDFANGTLITTSISASSSNGASFVIEITGKSYSSSVSPHSMIAQGYLYNNTIINYTGTNITGNNFTYIKAMNNNGYLSFWFPRHSYWNSYSVIVRDAGGASDNKVTAIANSSDPSGATKKVTINLAQTWNSGNDGSGSGLDADTVDGLHSSSFEPANGTIIHQGSDIGSQDWNTFVDGTEASWNTVVNMTGSNKPPNYTYGQSLSISKSSQAKFQLYASHTASAGNGLYYRSGWNTDYKSWAEIWDSNNDGSGSGLDADTVDGVQGSNFLRSDTADTASGKITMSTGIARNAHNSGHLEGSYNSVGANDAKSNPIYTIGSNYNPASTTLGNMYGIGYSHTNASFIGFAGSSGWGMYVAADGDARVYLSGQSGSGHFTGNITAYASDERLKTNITTIDNALDKVCQLRGVEYDWVDDITSEYDFHPTSMHETGVIAQDVQKVIPDAVCEAPMNANYAAKSGEDHEFLTVDKEKIIPVLIEAIKELKTEVNDLKTQLAEKE